MRQRVNYLEPLPFPVTRSFQRFPEWLNTKSYIAESEFGNQPDWATLQEQKPTQLWALSIIPNV